MNFNYIADSEVGHKSTSETEPIVSDFIDLNIWKRYKFCVLLII